MRARELAVEYPTVTPETPALEAARLLAEHHLLGLIVLDGRRRPKAVLPGAQLLRMAIPEYIQDDPNLARIYDEDHADRLCARLGGKSVAELLPTERTPPPIVDADATVMEIACVMASSGSPIVAVTTDPRTTDAPLLGVITVGSLLDHLLPTA